MNYKEHTRLDLVAGGNVFKQGDHMTLGFTPRDYEGDVVDLTGKDIEGVIYSRRKGIMFTAPADYVTAEQKIEFTIDEVLDHGEFQIEFTVTDAADPEYRRKFPSAEQDGRLIIKPSADNMDVVGVQMTTVSQLKNELQGLQSDFESSIVPQVDELKQRVDDGVGAFTEDTEVLDARMGEPNLRAFNEKLTTELEEKAAKTEVQSLVVNKAEKTYVDSSINAIDQKLNTVSSGTPKIVVQTVAQLPSTVGTEKIALVLADGHKYFHNGTTWVDAGVYQSTEFADKSVKPEKTSFLNVDKRNLLNPKVASDGYRLGVSGELLALDTFTTSDFIPVKAGEVFIIIMGTGTSAVSGRIVQYGDSKEFVSVLSTGTTTNNTFTATQDGFVRAAVPLATKNLTQIANINDYKGEFVPFGYLTDSNIKATTVDNNIISAANLTKSFRFRNTLAAPNLNTVLNDGTYLITGGGTNRPAEATDSNAYIDVTNIDNTVIQDYTQYTAGKQRKIFRRFIRVNVNEFGDWFLLNRDEEQGANYLENKTVVIMGDSITGGSGYYLQLSKRLRANVINCGFGGTRMTYHTDPNFDKFSFHKLVDAKITNNFAEQDTAASNITVTNMPENLANLKATDFSKVDYLTIWFGTNDFSGDIFIGENGSEDKTTVKGALQYGIRRLLETYPQLKIVVITPMFRTVGAGTSDDTPNTYRQLYLNDYSKAIEEVAKNNHVPCLNMYEKSGINKFNHTHYLSDGLHPYLEKGYVHVGNKIASFLMSSF